MNQRGQTSVEYILLLVIIVTITTSMFKLLESKLVGEEGLSGKYLDSFESSFTTNYKVFTLRRWSKYLFLL